VTAKTLRTWRLRCSQQRSSTLGPFRPERGPAAGWLFGIAQNKLRESRRRGRIESSARRRLEIPRVTIDDHDLERVDELAQSAGDLAEHLTFLSPEQREAIEGRIVNERG
jgi:RNA polymerase sigma-70 factor (ECF subfamily)